MLKDVTIFQVDVVAVILKLKDLLSLEKVF